MSNTDNSIKEIEYTFSFEKNDNATNFIFNGTNNSIFFKQSISKAMYLKDVFVNHSSEKLIKSYKSYVTFYLNLSKNEILNAISKKPFINFVIDGQPNMFLLNIFINVFEELFNVRLKRSN